MGTAVDCMPPRSTWLAGPDWELAGGEARQSEWRIYWSSSGSAPLAWGFESPGKHTHVTMVPCLRGQLDEAPEPAGQTRGFALA